MVFRTFIVICLSVLCSTLPAAEVQSEEHILLKTDRDIYISGESMFFSMWRQERNSGAGFESNYAYLVIRDSMNGYAGTMRVRFKDGQFSGAFYLPDTLKTGYYQVVAFTNYMRNFGEDHYFKKEIIVVNRFDENLQALIFSDEVSIDKSITNPCNSSLEILMEKDQFQSREKLSLQISYNTSNHEKIRGNLSVSIKESTLSHTDPPVSGYFPSFQLNEGEKLRYFPENEGVYYYGRVSDALKKPLTGVKVFVSVTDSIANLLYVTTGKNGEFSILLNEYYMGREVFFSLAKEVDGEISLEDKYQLDEKYTPKPSFLSFQQEDYIHLARNIVKVQKAFPLVMDFSPVAPKDVYAPRIYSEPSLTVYPSEYLFIENLFEMSREILPAVRTRKKGDSYSIVMRNDYTETYFDAAPLILLNGIPVSEIDPLIPLDSDEIRKIEYIAHERFIGELMFQGILAVFTLRALTVEPVFLQHTKQVFVPGNHPNMNFFIGKKYENSKIADDKIPDFRQTLYWNSSVIIESDEREEISFYCPDIEGEYLIEFTGFKENGESVFLNRTIYVGQ